ncbi:MAG TPA: ArsB/NhaD family transporter [Polyangiaceae bacterium]
MELVAAYMSLAVTLGLVVSRPRVRPGHRIGPAPAALAGVLIMVFGHVVTLKDAAGAALLLARPLLGIVALMVMATAAQRTGVVVLLAERVFAGAARTATRLFLGVFALSFVTAAVLNNDSAILLLTPAVVLLVRRRWPGEPRLVVAFAFAVFLAAGVAPLVLSNPMNMIVASYAGIDFNAYARAMIPVALAGSAVAAGAVVLLFRRTLAAAPVVRVADARRQPLRPAQKHLLAVVGAVLVACPFVAYFGGPVGVVAGVGAIVAVAIASRDARLSPVTVLREGIAWDILLFLALVNILGTGLRNVGLVTSLASLYSHTGLAGIGVGSALGSAILNNHPMAVLDMLALREVPGATSRDVLAALVGGDIGPRLLPMGSLAGLLWTDLLRREGIEVPIGRFVLIGAAVLAPTLAISLMLL